MGFLCAACDPLDDIASDKDLRKRRRGCRSISIGRDTFFFPHPDGPRVEFFLYEVLSFSLRHTMEATNDFIFKQLESRMRPGMMGLLRVQFPPVGLAAFHCNHRSLNSSSRNGQPRLSTESLHRLRLSVWSMHGSALVQEWKLPGHQTVIGMLWPLFCMRRETDNLRDHRRHRLNWVYYMCMCTGEYVRT